MPSQCMLCLLLLQISRPLSLMSHSLTYHFISRGATRPARLVRYYAHVARAAKNVRSHARIGEVYHMEIDLQDPNNILYSLLPLIAMNPLPLEEQLTSPSGSHRFTIESGKLFVTQTCCRPVFLPMQHNIILYNISRIIYARLLACWLAALYYKPTDNPISIISGPTKYGSRKRYATNRPRYLPTFTSWIPARTSWIYAYMTDLHTSMHYLDLNSN